MTTNPIVNGPRHPSARSSAIPSISAPTTITIMKQPAAPAMVATETFGIRFGVGSVIIAKVREFYHKQRQIANKKGCLFLTINMNWGEPCGSPQSGSSSLYHSANKAAAPRTAHSKIGCAATVPINSTATPVIPITHV